jgi:DNA-binding YbaB/EbfC family protein
MKLPKQFGGGGFAAALQQAQEAMSKAQDLEQELEKERIEIAKNGVKATFTGTGSLLSLKLDKDIVDPDDIETLEDLIVSTVRDGFTKATEIREKKVQEIMPNVPGLGGILPG